VDNADGVLREQYGHVLRFVRRRTNSATDAEDVVQEVFAAAAAALRARRAVGPPTLAWLYAVAQRRLADAARRNARSRSPALLLDEPATPASEYGAFLARTLRAALDELPAQRREVVVMKLFDGRSFAEIAVRLGVTEAACKMRFSRGLKQLRASLERKGVEP
jgi:RNA polymerase sigma-70 factor, ECF subfamily